MWNIFKIFASNSENISKSQETSAKEIIQDSVSYTENGNPENIKAKKVFISGHTDNIKTIIAEEVRVDNNFGYIDSISAKIVILDYNPRYGYVKNIKADKIIVNNDYSSGDSHISGEGKIECGTLILNTILYTEAEIIANKIVANHGIGDELFRTRPKSITIRSDIKDGLICNNGNLVAKKITAPNSVIKAQNIFCDGEIIAAGFNVPGIIRAANGFQIHIQRTK
jgi:hypothetical protein